MAQEMRDRLAAQLSALLGEIDAALAARLQEPRRHEPRSRRPDPTTRKGVHRIVWAALRWLAGPARGARQPRHDSESTGR